MLKLVSSQEYTKVDVESANDYLRDAMLFCASKGVVISEQQMIDTLRDKCNINNEIVAECMMQNMMDDLVNEGLIEIEYVA